MIYTYFKIGKFSKDLIKILRLQFYQIIFDGKFYNVHSRF